MTQSVPDRISAGDLESLRKIASVKEEKAVRDAAVNEECEEDERVHDGKTHQEVIDIAQKHMDEMYDECKSPMVHKVMAMMIIHRMMQWHAGNARSQIEKDLDESALAWASDAGKFRAALDTLRQISICEDDFTWRPDNNGDFMGASAEDDED